MSRATVLIIEDNDTMRLGLRRLLEMEDFSVLEAANGALGLSIARATPPHLIVLDIGLPDMSGYDVLSSLRNANIETPVLILSAQGEEFDKVYGFRLGADDYVTKPFSTAELTARIKALLRRAGASEKRDAGAVIQFGAVEVRTDTREVLLNNTPVALAPREYDLLLALINRDGAVAGRLDLLREVWGHRAAVATRTIDFHIAELRRKLEQDPAEPRHILTVRKVGYRLQR